MILLFLIIEFIFYLLLFVTTLHWFFYVFLIQHDEDYHSAMRYIHGPDHLYSIYYRLRNPEPKYDVHEDFHKHLAQFYWPITKQKLRLQEENEINKRHD